VDVDVPAVSDRQDVEVVVPTVSQYRQDVNDVEPAVSFENLPMFLKFEDTMGCYKPHFVKYERFLNINVDGDTSNGIFGAAETKKSLFKTQ